MYFKYVLLNIKCTFQSKNRSWVLDDLSPLRMKGEALHPVALRLELHNSSPQGQNDSVTTHGSRELAESLTFVSIALGGDLPLDAQMRVCNDWFPLQIRLCEDVRSIVIIVQSAPASRVPSLLNACACLRAVTFRPPRPSD